MKTRSIIQLLLCAAAVGMLAPLANAGGLQLGVGNAALSVGVDQNIIGPLSVDAAFVENYHKSDKLVNGGAHLDFGLGPVGAMVGVKAFYANASGQDGHGIAPGVGLSYSPLPMLTLSGQYYYSNPDYSSGDIDHYRDWAVTASIHPLKFTNFYVGYGSQVVDTRKYGNTDVYNGMFVGVNIGF